MHFGGVVLYKYQLMHGRERHTLYAVVLGLRYQCLAYSIIKKIYTQQKSIAFGIKNGKNCECM